MDQHSQLDLPQYQELYTQYDQHHKAIWCYFNPQSRACFTPELLDDISDLQSRLVSLYESSPEATDQIRYFVSASANPAVFGFGGDLDLFASMITEGNKEGLRAYGYRCVDSVLANWLHLGQPGLTTISLVQGKALGGGFEAALSSNVLVAERSAELGFPEIMFNLFPGMGAYSFLVRRVDPIMAERLLRDGEQHSAEELHEMGIVDVLAEDGEGVHAVCDYIRRHQRARNGLNAIRQLREWHQPLTRDELRRIADLWVEAAMQVTVRDLRTMARLASSQQRLAETNSVKHTDRQPGSRVVTAVPSIAQPQDKIAAIAR
jgi:DSF synthase